MFDLHRVHSPTADLSQSPSKKQEKPSLGHRRWSARFPIQSSLKEHFFQLIKKFVQSSTWSVATLSHKLVLEISPGIIVAAVSRTVQN